MSDLSPYLLGPYAPVQVENVHELTASVGEIPQDIHGMYVRNGPNPRFEPKGRYHWFDGDGMLHALRFEDGKATYRSRQVYTEHLRREIDNGAPLWSGLMESSADNPKDAPYKNTANTDVLPFGGELLAMWYLTGVPYRVSASDLSTLSEARFGQDRPKAISAHAKVDPNTGELSFFDFGFRPPFMHFGVVGADGALKQRVPVPLPGPRLPHDMALTERYAILMDLPLVFNEAALAKRRWMTEFDRELPTRFAVIPRGQDAPAIRWFEAEPCYIYHSVNAWEEGEEIVMVACRVDDPLPAPDPKDGKWAQMLANLRVRAKLHEWRMNLETGRVTERTLDDLNTEFPVIDTRRLGNKNRYSYNVHLADTSTLLFDGLVKYDIDSGRSERFDFGLYEYGSEPAFAPKVGATGEDDGYLVSFLSNEREGTSEAVIFDAKDIASGPITRLTIPTRVPLGFHACWAQADQGTKQ